MSNNILVSIIIPTWNRKRQLKECLDTVFQQTYSNKEIIVVDNGSKDDTKKMIDKHFPDIRFIYNKDNKGAAHAKNQGIKIAKGEFVWFLDSDSVILHKTCLLSMLDIWGQHKDIGALGGEIVQTNEETRQEMRVYDFYKNGMSYAKTHFVKDGELEKKVGFLPTFNLFTSKKILYQVGGFDPYYFYLAEDKELCFKIRKLDYKIISNIKTSIAHNRKELYGQRLRKSKSLLYNLHRNRIRFVIINYSFKELIQLPVLDFIKRKGFQTSSISDVLILIIAYLRNIIFSPREILIRCLSPNFLRKTK